MCGIAGIIANPHRIDLPRLKRMTDAIAHRGPDGEDAWIHPDGTVALGHRRLAILDLSPAGQQPMHCLDRYTLIHNGEIYNYLELKIDLESKGYRFRTRTDTEVIAAAYDHYGEDCLDLLNGMFAFALWDEKEKTFFAARDRFGEKPFFFFRNEEEFVFASEIKALWAAGIPRQTNRRMLFNYLTIGYLDNPAKPADTFFENIQKLPAACRLIYKPKSGEWSIEKYWDIDRNERSSSKSTQQITTELLNRLNTSIKFRLRSDVPIGCSLSGGLDSSSLLYLIGEIEKGKSIHSFSAVFPGFEKNEEPYIDRLLSRVPGNNEKIRIDSEDLPGLLEKVARQLDEPFASASNLAQYAVYEKAKKAGVKVLLDGQGADEILAGYTRYYKWFWQELFRRRKLLLSGEYRKAQENGVREKFGFKNMVAALVPDLASVVLEQRYLVKALKHPELDPEFLREQSRDAYLNKPAIQSLNDALYYNTCTHGLEELLRYADRNSMAHGVEVRLPFLDHNLVEYVFSLPGDLKIHQGLTKWILRETMKNYLPEEITWRKEKVGFEPPQQDWMKNPRIIEMIQESKKKLVVEKILLPSTLNNPPQAHDAYSADGVEWRYLSAGSLLGDR